VQKNVKLVAITKSHQEFSSIEIVPFTEELIFEKSSEKNIFLQSALAEMCQFSHKKAFSFGLASL